MKHVFVTGALVTAFSLTACTDPEAQSYQRVLETESFLHLSCSEINNEIGVVESYMAKVEQNLSYDVSQDVGDLFAQAGEQANLGNEGASKGALAGGLLLAAATAIDNDRTKRMAKKGNLLWTTKRTKGC